ncbi:glycosyltransferase [Roseovarius mucosus]|uniref:glycosyltransferase n=1 Tax=Roseovarius mucosus TaxID=215743 RepID=UPI0035D06667
MAQFVRLSLLRRFISVTREYGLAEALNRSRYFAGLYLRGSAPSLFGRQAPAPFAPNTSFTPERQMQTIWSELARGEGFHAQINQKTSPRIALIGDLNLSQCRKYRVEQLQVLWKSQNVEFDFAHYEDTPRALRLLQRATHYCEYRLEDTPLTQMYRYEARRLGLPILFDIDDPLFSVAAYETYQNMANLDPMLKTHFLTVAPRYAAMINGADIVTVSTPGLADLARLYTPRPVYVRRNFADPDTLENGAAAIAARGPADGLFRVVFASGSQGHEADFDLIKTDVAAFVTADPTRRLTILGHFQTDKLPASLMKQTEHHPFLSYDAYLTNLARADVAVMPLQDDLFNRCKSGVRVIDAAAVGLASIVSAVGDLPTMIDHGRTGFIASAPSDWRLALEALANDRARARVMGSAARETLETRWSVQAEPHIIAPALLDWVKP